MTTTSRTDEARDGRVGQLARLARLGPVHGVLLALAVGLVAMLPLLGSRTASYDDLRREVRSGSVEVVAVSDSGLGPEARGYSTVEVSWRDRILRHTAEVVESRPRSEGLAASDDLPVIGGDVGSDLRSLDPGLRLVEADHPWGATLAGWTVPEWVLLASLALWLAALASLSGGGSPPLRASRWGWFWVVTLLQPFGVLAYLVLGRPGLLREPAPRARRLTGGWSFLLTVLVLVPLLS